MLQPSMVSWHPSCSPPLIHDKKFFLNVFCVQNMPRVGGGYLKMLKIKSCLIQTKETVEDTLYKKTKVRLQITVRQLIGRRWGNLEIWNHDNSPSLNSTKTKEVILEARATIDLSASEVRRRRWSRASNSWKCTSARTCHGPPTHLQYPKRAPRGSASLGHRWNLS